MAICAFGTPQNTQTPFGSFAFGATSTPAQTSQPAATNPLGTTNLFSGFGTTTTSSIFGNTAAAPTFSTPIFPTNTTTTNSLFPTLNQTTTTGAAPGAITFSQLGNPAGSTSTFGPGSLLPASSTAATVPTLGLGGVDVQASNVQNGTNTSNKKDGKAIKDTQLPNEIMVIVESFKKYVKEQKAIREEMSRISSKNIFKVQELVSSLKQQLSVVSNGLQRNAVGIAKVKEETNQELKNAEIAQRTKDSLSLQYENNAPTEYFYNLANSFEKQMQSYRHQIEQLERHLLSLSEPYVLTPDEWVANRRRLHDTFVTLAAQLQTIHQEIQVYKEQFLHSQKVNQGDLKFLEKKDMNGVSVKRPVTYGPSPFSAMQSAAGKAIIHVYNGSRQLQAGSPIGGFTQFESSTAGRHLMMSLGTNKAATFQSPSPFKTLGQSGMPSFGSSSPGDVIGFGGDTSAQSQFALNNQKPFQLQKPPAGNKRGKRWTST